MLVKTQPLQQSYQSAQQQYRQRIGPQDMMTFVGEQQLANQDLAQRIEALKAQTGFSPVPPFLPPEDFPAGEYYLVVYNQIWTELQNLARNRNVAPKRLRSVFRV